MSSAGVAFTYIKEVPAITLASWRLQLTAVITAAAGSAQWAAAMTPEAKARFRSDLHLTALSGLSLTLHFAAWVWSLQHTTLAHSLLLVSTSPVINVGVALLLKHAISAGEVAGALAALAGEKGIWGSSSSSTLRATTSMCRRICGGKCECPACIAKD